MVGVSLSGPIGGAWVAYRKLACTAVYHKSAIDRFTKQGLWLGIAGAVLATLGQQLAPFAPKDGGALALLYKAPGVLGAAAVALAAFIGKQAFAADRVKTWTRARAAAESLKSMLYLYRTSAPPFDGPDRADQFLSKVQKVVDDTKDIETRPQDGKPEPPPTLTQQDYISERLEDQVKWYEKRAQDHQAKADLCRKSTAALGGLGALLALASAVQSVSAWAAVVATVTASIAAHMKNQQYETLVASYQTTATRLRLLPGRYGSGIDLVRACEDTMAAENGAWATVWSQKEGQKG